MKKVNPFKFFFWLFFLLAVLFLVPLAFAQSAEPPVAVVTVNAYNGLAWTAAGLSLFLDYFPGIAKKYDNLTENTKRLISVGLAFILVYGAFFLTCQNIISSSLVCSRNGAIDAFTGIIFVIVVQYGFHKATKPTDEMKNRMGFGNTGP